mgnify:CR=1 FL=1
MLSWYALSMTAAVLLAILVLIVKRGLNEGISSWLWMMYYYTFASIFLAVYLISNGSNIQVSKFLILLLIAASILGVLGNVASTQAVKLAPNPGYSMAVTSTQALLIVIASVFLFGSEFTILKGLGTFLVVAGVILLGL